MRHVEDDRVNEALRLLSLATGHGQGREEIGVALRHLLRWTPESTPKQFSPRSGSGYSKGDEKAPFFSESYLYVLLGKEDARTLLGMFSELCERLGFTRQEQVALQDGPRREPARLLVLTGPMRGQVIPCRDWSAAQDLGHALEWGALVSPESFSPCGSKWCLLADKENPEERLAKEDRERAKKKAKR